MWATALSKPSGKVRLGLASQICRPYHQGTHMGPVSQFAEVDPTGLGGTRISVRKQRSRARTGSVGVVEMACGEGRGRQPRETCPLAKPLV